MGQSEREPALITAAGLWTHVQKLLSKNKCLETIYWISTWGRIFKFRLLVSPRPWGFWLPLTESSRYQRSAGSCLFILDQRQSWKTTAHALLKTQSARKSRLEQHIPNERSMMNRWRLVVDVLYHFESFSFPRRFIYLRGITFSGLTAETFEKLGILFISLTCYGAYTGSTK